MLRNVLYSILLLVGTGGHLLAQTDATLPPVVVTPPEVSEPTTPESTGSMQPTPMSNSFEQPLETSPTPSNLPQSIANDVDAFSSVWPSSLEQTFATNPSDVSGLSSLFRTDASIIDSAQLATIVDQQTIQQQMSNNMFRALQNEVGVTLQQTGNGQLSPFIRGLTGQQILVMVDGIRVNNSILRAGPNQYAATIDPGMIDHIEVVRGAQSVLWGSDALGGAINIVTRGANPLSADYSRFSFNQVLGSADESSYSRANVEGWVGQSGVFAGGSYLNTNDLDIGGGLGEQPGTGYSQYAGDVKFNRLLDDSTLLTFALQHFEQNDLARSDRFLPFVLGPAPNGNSATQRPTFFDPQQRDLVYLRLNGLADTALMDSYSTTISYTRIKEGSSQTRFNSNAANAVPTRLEEGEFTDDMLGVNAAATKDLCEFGQVTYGFDYYYEDINASRVRTNNPADPNSVPMATDPQYPDDAIADRFGLFLNWDVMLTDRLGLNTGVRYENLNMSATPNFDGLGDIHFQRTYQDWIASVGLNYKLTEKVRAVGGIYEGFRAPTLDDLTANKTAIQNVQTVPRLGDLDIQPEHTRTYEVGLKTNGDFVRLQAIQWWTDFESVIGREFVGTEQFLANQQATLNGTELAGDILLTDAWSLYGNFSYVYGRNNTVGEPFSRIPPTQGIVGLRWANPQTARYLDIYTWLVRRQDRYASANLGDVRFIPGGTPGYGTLNLRMGAALDDDHRHLVRISLENITDKYYRVLGSGVDGAGFNALLGYEYSR